MIQKNQAEQDFEVLHGIVIFAAFQTLKEKNCTFIDKNILLS